MGIEKGYAPFGANRCPIDYDATTISISSPYPFWQGERRGKVIKN